MRTWADTQNQERPMPSLEGRIRRKIRLIEAMQNVVIKKKKTCKRTLQQSMVFNTTQHRHPLPATHCLYFDFGKGMGWGR
jgi:hypothetical protein